MAEVVNVGKLSIFSVKDGFCTFQLKLSKPLGLRKGEAVVDAEGQCTIPSGALTSWTVELPDSSENVVTRSECRAFIEEIPPNLIRAIAVVANQSANSSANVYPSDEDERLFIQIKLREAIKNRKKLTNLVAAKMNQLTGIESSAIQIDL